MKSTFLHMVLALGLVTLISSFSLGLVYNLTKEPIAQAKIDKENRAIQAVSGAYDNDPLEESYHVHRRQGRQHRFRRRHRGSHHRFVGDSGQTVLVAYPAKQNQEQKVTAFKSFSDKGYSGRIELMVGINNVGKIVNIEVLNHRETPGLGSKISEKDFIDQFIGQSLSSFDFIVKKDGGQVDGISGATISSRAFSEAVKLSLEAYKDTNDETQSDQ